MFDVDERSQMLREVDRRPTRTSIVDTFHGLLVDYCRDHDARPS